SYCFLLVALVCTPDPLLDIMAALFLAYVALFHLLTPALTATLRVKIQTSNILPNPGALPASTHATLTSGSGAPIKAVLRKGNFIEFSDIPTTGSHLLDIYSRDYVFAPYRIDIDPSASSGTVITGAWETYRGTKWEDRGVALVTSPTTEL